MVVFFKFVALTTASVVRFLGYISRDPGSIPNAGSGTGSTRPR
jgi:hypothetical protein